MAYPNPFLLGVGLVVYCLELGPNLVFYTQSQSWDRGGVQVLDVPSYPQLLSFVFNIFVTQQTFISTSGKVTFSLKLVLQFYHLLLL